jgi:hypothetical protein
MGGVRKIAVIVVADIVGYSRLAGADEDRTLSRLRGLRSDLIDPAIDAHHGRIVKRTGDGGLIEFRSVVDAVRCVIEVQNGLIERNAGLPPERRIEFRVGIHRRRRRGGRRRSNGRRRQHRGPARGIAVFSGAAGAARASGQSDSLIARICPSPSQFEVTKPGPVHGPARDW